MFVKINGYDQLIRMYVVDHHFVQQHSTYMGMMSQHHLDVPAVRLSRFEKATALTLL